MTLDELIENERGIIVNIDDEHLALQLLSMGFLLGKEIILERIAPLKDPIAISSGNSYISIRKSDAKKIEVKKITFV